MHTCSLGVEENGSSENGRWKCLSSYFIFFLLGLFSVDWTVKENSNIIWNSFCSEHQPHYWSIIRVIRNLAFSNLYFNGSISRVTLSWLDGEWLTRLWAQLASLTSLMGFQIMPFINEIKSAWWLYVYSLLYWWVPHCDRKRLWDFRFYPAAGTCISLSSFVIMPENQNSCIPGREITFKNKI